jgi:hypothetical protein
MSGGCVNGTDQEEIPTSVSQRIRKFLDIAKQNFFPTKKDCSSLFRDQRRLSKRMSQKELLEKDTLTGAGGHLRAAQRASDIPQGSLAHLQQVSTIIPAPLKQT